MPDVKPALFRADQEAERCREIAKQYRDRAMAEDWERRHESADYLRNVADAMIRDAEYLETLGQTLVPNW